MENGAYSNVSIVIRVCSKKGKSNFTRITETARDGILSLVQIKSHPPPSLIFESLTYFKTKTHYLYFLRQSNQTTKGSKAKQKQKREQKKKGNDRITFSSCCLW